ncbi:MAG: TrkA C-terminal domain-containing protein [Ilumatobacteraceae bacterium]
MACWLQVSAPMEKRAARADPALFAPATGCVVAGARRGPGSPITDQPLVELGLPVGTMIVLIERDDESTVPTGSTVLVDGDRLLILGDDASIQRFRERSRRRVQPLSVDAGIEIVRSGSRVPRVPRPPATSRRNCGSFSSFCCCSPS